MERFSLVSVFVVFLLVSTYVHSQFTCNNKNDGFYPHPSDCTSYYICAVTLVYNVKCAAGLHFNALMRYCDLPQNANCATYPVIPITQPTRAPITTTQSTTNILTGALTTNAPRQTTKTPQRPPVTTGKFPYWIFTSRPTVNGKITKATYARPTTIHPTFPQNLTNKPLIIPGSNTICNGKKSGLYPDPTDCGHYYQCVYGLTIRQPCPPNLVFSDGKNTCDYPVKVPRCLSYQYPG